jgi:thiamine biosynthesis lipoprotein
VTAELPPPIRFRALGTSAVVAVTAAGARDEAGALLAAELEAIDRACSRFRADSELTRVNRSAGAWVAVSRLFLAAVDVALLAALDTGGVVDPTVGKALRVLGYDRDFAEVERAGAPLLVRVQRGPGWRAVEVDAAGARVRVPKGVELDLGATAKAFAADRSARRITEATGAGVVVALGGDCSIAGPPPDGGWPIRVADVHDAPDDAPGVTVALGEGGLATSGTAHRRWTRGDAQLHHLVDPSTGRPAAPVWRTVTVAAPACVDANVASTAAVIIGEVAPAWLERRGVRARLVAGDGAVVAVGGWPADPTPRVAGP